MNTDNKIRAEIVGTGIFLPNKVIDKSGFPTFAKILPMSGSVHAQEFMKGELLMRVSQPQHLLFKPVKWLLGLQKFCLVS